MVRQFVGRFCSYSSQNLAAKISEYFIVREFWWWGLVFPTISHPSPYHYPLITDCLVVRRFVGCFLFLSFSKTLAAKPLVILLGVSEVNIAGVLLLSDFFLAAVRVVWCQRFVGVSIQNLAASKGVDCLKPWGFASSI